MPAGELVIAAAGQLIPRKGHRFLLQAAAELNERRVRAQAASLGLGDIVQFAGFRDDLDDFMGCIDIFVHPALAEGLGVIALKAAAAGVPVVGFAAGGMVEAVLHDETGILVEPEDVSGLRAAIAGLIDDDERRRELGAAGRRRMQNEFSITTLIDRHIELYESVLHG